MAYRSVHNLWYGHGGGYQVFRTTFANTTGTIDATGEKIAFIGRFRHAEHASKSITKIGFRFGAVTKAGGSALTVSLQNVDLTVGPPIQPDGTQDQTIAIANADAGFAANVPYLTGALSASRTVAPGELLAVVFEFDGAGRLGADTVGIFTTQMDGQGGQQNGMYTFAAGTWTLVGGMPPLYFECTDGSYGTLEGCMPVSSSGQFTFNTGTTPDEVALELSVPFNCKIDGAFLASNFTSGADSELILYDGDGTTPLHTTVIDSNAIAGASGIRPVFATPSSEIKLKRRVNYRLALKPTTANSVLTYFYEVANAGQWDLHNCGRDWGSTTRTDGGIWTARSTVRRLFGGIRLSAIDFPSSNVIGC